MLRVFRRQKYDNYSINFIIFADWCFIFRHWQLLKRTLKILWLTAVAVTAVLLAGVLAVQTPQVQTYFTRKLLSGLDKSIEGRIEFEKIHFKPFNALVIKDVSIIDDEPVIEGMDTLFHAGYIIARFSLKGLTADEGVYIRRVYIADAQMNLAVKNKSVNLMRMFGLERPEAKKEDTGKHIFSVNRVNVVNMSFRMRDESDNAHVRDGYGMDWSDLEVNSINISARRLDMTGKVMSGILDFMSFEEKSGYVCNALSGRAEVGNGKAEVRNLKLSDPWSEISIPEYTMTYDWGRDFEDFVNKVHLYGDIAQSDVDMKTIAFFAPALKDLSMNLKMKGIVSGPVRDLNFADFSLEASNGAELGFSGRVTGLPDIRKAHLEANIDSLVCTTRNVAELMGPGKTAERVAGFAEGVTFFADGSVSGRLDDMDADIRVMADSGSVAADVRIRNLIAAGKQISVEGNVNSRNFDIGRIISSDFIRQCTMDADFRAAFGGGDGASATIDTLKVSRLRVNGYDYSGIAAAGRVETREFDGRIICNDPNLNFLLQGIFSLSPKTNNALYKFYANVGYADLNAMNFDKRGLSKISLRTTANFNRIGAGDILGNIEVDDIVLENSLGKHDIGTISVSSHSGENLYRINLDSEFADASFSGSDSFMNFIKDLGGITLKRELPALFRDTTETWSGDRYHFSFKSHDSRDLMAYLMPGVYIADSTGIEMNVDSAGLFTASIVSPRIAYNENYVRNLKFEFDNREHRLGGELLGETVRLSTIDLESNRLQLYAHDNFVGVGYSYENSGDLINRGELVATMRLSKDGEGRTAYNVEFLPSRIVLNSEEWSINSSTVDILGKNIRVNDFRLTNGDQTVGVDGGMSDVQNDTLELRLERFDISILNSIVDKDLGIAGAATGRARLISSPASSSFSDRGILLGFVCDSASFAGTPIGTFRLGSEWNESMRRFDILARNELYGKQTFGLSGNYTPSKKSISVTAGFDRFDISYIRPFTESIFSDIAGHISGEISLSGPLNDLKLSSKDAVIDDSEIRIAYTNVPYNATGGFHIDDEGVHFDSIGIRDRHGNTGSVTGGIALNGFKDIRFDTRINVSEMECLNLEEGHNPTFYGNISASGNLHLTGRTSSMRMDIDASTTGSGQLHIPLSGTANAVTSDLLTFKEEEKEVYVDPYEEMIRKMNRTAKTSSALAINASIAATPGVEAFIEIDKASGNVLRGRGAGQIDLEMEDDNFNIYGDYTLTAGSYRFVAQGLAYRDFTIQDGSSVKFNGDIMQSTLDIDAVYRTKTSLSTLIADTSSVATRRTVECGINISDQIRNPRLSFSINIPDIDPTVKSRVESALSTEDKVQKQFLALMVFNNFLPDEQSGIVNNASVLYSTVTDIMYSQLNNILQKLDIPFDLGLNYQANDKGQDFFDVAVSTQLFNNRVVVNGNIGNRQYSSSGTSNSDVVGDLDIEIKLDRTGLFRLNIFSHSSDQYTNYLDNSQRNGVGIAYQQEFNTFKEFFRKLFMGRKKRKAEAEAENSAVQQRKRLIIEPDGEDQQRRQKKTGNERK